MSKISVLKIFLLGAIFCVNPIFAARQSDVTVKGTVVEKSSGSPAGWATVSLMTADSTIVAGTTCDQDGTYQLKASAGTYTLTASLIGYKSNVQEITLQPGETNIAPIQLEDDVRMLEGATVTERVQLVEMKLDKVVMNVSQSAFATGSDALELIKKAPGVTVDKDGNVKLNGKAVSVWIDGRPSHLDGKSLESLLKSTNGESIDKFELMEHPSSKYDAEGQGGIINIKTKRNLKQGFNGTIGITGSGMYFKKYDIPAWDHSAFANLSLRTKKTNTFLNVYEGLDASGIRTVNDLTIAPQSFHQIGTSLLKDFTKKYNVKFGNDWFIDDKNTLGVILFVPGGSFCLNSTESGTEQFISDSRTSKITSVINNGPMKAIRHNLNLNYTHIFDEARSAELTTNLDYYHNLSSNSSSQEDTTFFASAPTTAVFSKKTMNSNQIYDIYSAKADYQSVVWKKFMLEAGAKWALSHTDNNSVETQTLMPDRNSDFIYREHVGAAYFSLAGQLGPKWSFKAGLRGEYTNSYGDWKTSGTHLNRDYFDLFPTAYVGFNPSEKWRLSLSYTRRIMRPNYYVLDPIKTYVDAKTYTVGNPDILPQYSDDATFTAGFGQNFSWSLGYNHTGNAIEQVPSYDADGVQYLTWGNLGKYDIAYAAFNISALPVGKWLQWTLSVTGMYLNSVTGFSDKSKECWNLEGYTDFSFLLPKDWKIDLDGFFSSPTVLGMYKIHSYAIANIAAKKTLLDNRLTLTLKLNDIFRSMNMDIDIIDETGTGAFTALKQKYLTQKASVSLTWNFGKAQRPVRQRNVGSFDEMSRVGNGSKGIGGK